ncbi:unnamed protein product [Brassica rapa subsp. narinosa]
MGDRPWGLDKLHSWHRNILVDSMIIDIILVHPHHHLETVMERWVVHYENPLIFSPQLAAEFVLIYKVSSFRDDVLSGDVKEFRLYLLVVFAPLLLDLSEFNLGAHITLPPRIITDIILGLLFKVELVVHIAAFTDLQDITSHRTSRFHRVYTISTMVLVVTVTSFHLAFRGWVLLLLQDTFQGLWLIGIHSLLLVEWLNQISCLQVAHQDSGFRGARVDYLLQMIWMTLIVHALLISMMLTNQDSSTPKVLTGGKFQVLYHSRYL